MCDTQVARRGVPSPLLSLLEDYCVHADEVRDFAHDLLPTAPRPEAAAEASETWKSAADVDVPLDPNIVATRAAGMHHALLLLL